MSSTPTARSLDATYCPHCGARVDRALAAGLTDVMPPGVYERPDGHCEVTGAEVRIYEHADAGADDA